MAKIKATKYFPARVDIDGVTINVLLRRQTLDEFTEFERCFFEFGTPDPGVTVAVEGEDQMTVEEILIARGKAAQARIDNMTPEQQEAERQRVVEKSNRLTTWIREQIEGEGPDGTPNFALPEGEIDGPDDRPVTTGKVFMQLYGSRYTLLMQVINLMWAANRLPEDVKKKVLSPSDSPATSSEPA